MSAQAFWITGVGQGEIRSVELPRLRNDQVQVSTLFTGISRGTEYLVFNGLVPNSEHQRMQAPFQDGEFSFPVKYGYINVGKVEQGPTALQGRKVFCLYPHQSEYVVPADAVTILPESVPTNRAILGANLETAINALWDAQPAVGDRISIVGAGVIGCLVAWLASRIPGCEVELIDVNSNREVLAEKLGVDFKLPEQASEDRDLVIHASASEQGINTALNLAGFEATVLELSWYGSNAVSVPLGKAFHSRRLQIRSSQVGQIAPTQRARWDYKRRLELALSMLKHNELDNLISGESQFAELPETMHNIMKNGRDVLCHRICY